MNRGTWAALTAGGVLAAGLLAWAFAPRPIEVEAVPASRGAFETAVEEDGRTRVRERYAVVAPIAGRLRRITWREGDGVQAGQPLAQIEPLYTPLLDDRSRREQQAHVAALQSAWDRAVTRVRAAEVGVAQALNEQHRTAQLVAQGFVSPVKADADRLALEAARHERESAEESVRVARHELEQARVALDVAARTTQGARAAAGARTARGAFAVVAPIAGTVLRVHLASEGVVGPGTPLLDVADTTRIEVVAELLTADAALIRTGSPVRIERWGGSVPLQGRVRRIEPAAFTKVSALGVEEQRVNVVIDLTAVSSAASGDAPSPSAMGDGWRVVARILTRQEADVLRVPVSAVFPWPASAQGGAAQTAPAPKVASDERMGLFVIDRGRARLRAVQVGARNGNLAWIRDGLAPGEQVIAYPPPAVADGVRVTARRR